MDSVSYEPLHTYVVIARGIACGYSEGLPCEAAAIGHVSSAIRSGSVDPHLILAVFLDPERVL